MAAERTQLHGPWRSNLEALTVAVVMAVFLKAFLVEVYRIPTGSMQPTLFGDRKAGVSDRILVDKLSYAVRAPRRWEVAVFDYPLNRLESYIKRIVGVGPEELRIRRGDLWHRAGADDEWRILRRPRAVQDAVLRAIERDGQGPSWEASAGWRVEGRDVHARGDGQAEYLPERDAIRDGYLDGYPEPLRSLIRPKPSVDGVNDVADLRVEADVRALPGTRAIAIELTEGERRYAFAIPGPAAAADARPRIRVHDERPGLPPSPLSPGATGERFVEEASGTPYRLPANERVRVRAQNIDDLLELEIDGDWVVALEIPSADDLRAKVYLACQGEGADWEDLMVYRDVYYTADTAKTASVTIPDGYYFMLGDNTQDSSDGRDWIFTRFRVGEGGDEQIVRGDTRDDQNPRVGGLGLLDGPLTRFEDEWGEVHWFRGDEAQRVAPETAPLVRRDLIRGRALAVFWPLNPLSGVYRLGWVN